MIQPGEKVKVGGAWYAAEDAFRPTWLVKRWLDPGIENDYVEAQVSADPSVEDPMEVIKLAIQAGSWA